MSCRTKTSTPKGFDFTRVTVNGSCYKVCFDKDHAYIYGENSRTPDARCDRHLYRSVCERLHNQTLESVLSESGYLDVFPEDLDVLHG